MLNTLAIQFESQPSVSSAKQQRNRKCPVAFSLTRSAVTLTMWCHYSQTGDAIMIRSTFRAALAIAVIVGAGWFVYITWSTGEPRASAEPTTRLVADQGMTPTKKAEALGIKLGKVEPKYLN